MQGQPHYTIGQDGQLYLHQELQRQSADNHYQQFQAAADSSSSRTQQEQFGHGGNGIAAQGNPSNRLVGFDANSTDGSPMYHQEYSSYNPAMFQPQHSLYQQQHAMNTEGGSQGQYGFGYDGLTMPGGMISGESYGQMNTAPREQYSQQPQYQQAFNSVRNGDQPTLTGYTAALPADANVEAIYQQAQQHQYNQFQQGFQPQPQQSIHQPDAYVPSGPITPAHSLSPERSSAGARDHSSEGNANGKKHKKSDTGAEESRHAIAPPVKNACLACRSKKARCDGGQPVCSQCVSKGRECQYVKSRRGGARKKKENFVQPTPSALAQFLKQLDDLAGFKFDPPPDMGDLQLDGKAVDPALAVRSWKSDDVHGILTAYWEEIHPFQALLPPARHLPFIATRLTPDSPFLIAIRAILALCPNPADPAAKSLASRAMRRSQASRLAQEASSRVDEMLSEANENDVPPSIECVQTLTLLGLYEFAQNGNAVRNRMRMNQAVQVAMEMGLHQTDKNSFESADPSKPRVTPAKAVEGEDVLKDMARRTWWVTFAGMLISGLVAGSRPVVAHDDRRLAVHYPACTLDDDSWSNWVESIGLCCEAMDIIMTLDFNFPNPDAQNSSVETDSSDEELQSISDPSAKQEAQKKKRLHKQMLKLDKSVLELLKQGETKSVIPLVPGGEEEVVRNQQLSTSMMLAVCHIQLHRRQAFPEVALFSRKMCGLPKSDGAKVPPTPEQPLSVYSAESSAFVSTESPSGAESLYAGSQMLSGYQDSGSLMAGSANGNDGRNLGYMMPVTPVQTQQSQPPAVFNNMDLSSQALQQLPMEGLLWDPALYPQSFPPPWFAMPRGAASLYQPVNEAPAYLPAVPGIFSAETGYIGHPLNGYQADSTQFAAIPGTASMQDISPTQASRLQPHIPSRTVVPEPPVINDVARSGRSATRSVSGQPDKPHKAWGVDVNRAPVQLTLDRTQVSEKQNDNEEENDEPVVVGPDGPFPPGISLQRCATAAHSVVRLEVLHRSATLAMWKGPPKWLPFCACGLVCGAYSFLLLCLAVQAGNFPGSGTSDVAQEELEALWTNVKVILAGLQAYGQMWDGIDLMASEVKAALEAATQLPGEVASSYSVTPPGKLPAPPQA